MKQFQILIERIIDSIASLLMFLIITLVMLVFLTVLLRYTFNISYVFLQELIMYFHALIFMFGISYTLKEKSHVKIDVIFKIGRASCRERV